MLFVWHHALWLLLALPGVVAAYVALLRRRRREGLRYPGLGPVRESAAALSIVRPHLPAAILLAGITVLLLSAARPVIVVTSPSDEGTVVLLMDVSLSMAATDVPPTRLDAARAAAKAFVDAQPRNVRIGIVAFGGYADLVQAPTLNRRDVLAALDHLELQRFTAIGNGLMAALLTLVPTARIPQGYDIFGAGQAPPQAYQALLDARLQPLTGPHMSLRAGSVVSAAIILVSDGRGTMGVPATQAAKLVAEHGIRVFTIGVGTLYGGTANVEGWPAIHAEFSEETLQEIADVTGGDYFLARTADKVGRVYEKLGRRVVLRRNEHEVTALLATLGVILSLTSAAFSLVWPHRFG